MKRLLILLLLLAGCTPKTQTSAALTPEQTLENPHFVIITTSEPTTEVRKLDLVVSRILLHNTDGWQTLNQDARSFDLTQTKNQNLLNITISPGHYDYFKLFFSQARVTPKATPQKLHLAGNDFLIPLELNAEAGHTYILLLRFNLPQSLYNTRDNQYVFAPQMEVQVIDQAGPEETTLKTYLLGMNENGNVEENLRVSPHAEFRIIHDKLHATQYFEKEFNSGFNLYIQSQNSHTPIHATLKEVRLKNNDTISVYHGEQDLLLDGGHVQKITSELIPAESYSHIKLYFEDYGKTDDGTPIEITTPILTLEQNNTVLEDQTLNLLIILPVQENGRHYSLGEPIVLSSKEKSIRTDASYIGQRVYIPNADIETVREADKEGLFKT